MLRQLNLKAVYRSEYDNLLEDFYIPALSNSLAYDRAVGFFSASMLSYAAQGLSAFVENDGHMRLIFGGPLEPDDERAIREGYDRRAISDRLGSEFVRAIEEVDDALFYRRLELLSWLVASGRLEVKVALKKRGMYHEKIGILTDADGDKVIFQGSANETTNALLPDFNFESINVFQGWRSELSDHFTPYVAGFERLWENKSPNTLVLSFPDAAKEKLIKIANRAPKLINPRLESEIWKRYAPVESDVRSHIDHPQVPAVFNGSEFSILAHQRKALDAWKANGFQGIMALATGAGKTVTAIYGAVRIYEQTKRLCFVIAVPYQNLADQWCGVLAEFNIVPIRCYGSAAEWFNDLTKAVSLYQTGALNFLCVVVVNRTLQSEQFGSLLQQIPGENLLWVGDECHHHSASGLLNALPDQAALRLGLSATPEHYLDTDRNSRLVKFYGRVVAAYSLEEALSDGVLSPYKYHVVLVDLTEEEVDEYRGLTEQISKLSARANKPKPNPNDDEQLKMLLFRRARLLGKAHNKISELEKLLKGLQPAPLTLFYCGDGSTEDQDSQEPMRQVEAVSSRLYRLGWKSSVFTARETRTERDVLLDYFRLALIDALVAIRCLDEGIDVPACRTAYILASSKNPRQFIQRRGRILRKSPGKEFAEIFDFMVRIPEHLCEGNDFERKLIRGELERVAEFARMAINSGDAVRTLKPILDQYDLSHIPV